MAKKEGYSKFTFAYFLKENTKKYSNKILFKQKTRYRTFTKTYADFYRLTSKTANFLIKNKIKKGDRIIIYCSNSPGWVAILGACSMIGAVLVPIDIKSNITFIKKIQDQINAKLIFTSYSNPLKEKIAQNIFIEDLYDLTKNEKQLNQFNPNPDDLLEIIYTSGTTAEPKGVTLTNLNIISNIKEIKSNLRFKTQRFLSILPLSHMFEQGLGLLYPIISGSSIIYPYSIKQSVLKKTINKEKITAIVCVPAFLESIYNSIIWTAKKEKKLEDLERLLELIKKINLKNNNLKRIISSQIIKKIGKSLRYIGVGGVALDPKIEEFFTLCGFELIKGYGLTETSPVISITPLGKPKLGMVGKVLENIEFKIKENKEILVKGLSVTKGYYNDPEANITNFEHGWLKTGDLGELDNNGYLRILDRKKDIIISSSGLNVYPTDIEKILNNMAEIKESCIIGIKETVHAVIIPEKKITEKEAEEIIRKANTKLAEHQKIMGLTIWHKESFPKTTTLKIKKNLVRSELELITKEQKQETIKLKREEKVISRPLYKILSYVANIDIEKISPDAKLYTDLKIDSLSRLDLISRIEEEMDLELNETLINSETTVKGLEMLIRKHREIKLKMPYTTWQYQFIPRLVGAVMRKFFIDPITAYFCKVKTTGLENLKKIDQCIFVSNHQSLFDISIIFRTMPHKFIKHIAIASSAEVVFRINDKNLLKRMMAGFLTRLLYHTYPLPQDKGVRQSFEYSGMLADKGLSLFIFPEGTRTKDGKIHEFKKGIGFLAKEMNLPIVPIRIKGLYDILPIHKKMPKKGNVSIDYRKPIWFENKDSAIEITNRLKKEVSKNGN